MGVQGLCRALPSERECRGNSNLSAGEVLPQAINRSRKSGAGTSTDPAVQSTKKRKPRSIDDEPEVTLRNGKMLRLSLRQVLLWHECCAHTKYHDGNGTKPAPQSKASKRIELWEGGHFISS
jgi:hypothetical protein